MKNIVILGQSFGAGELAKMLAQKSEVIKVSVFSMDGQPAHDQDLIADYMAKKISRDQVLSADKDFYKTNGIQLILDQKLDRVSLHQRKLTTESCLPDRQAKEHIKFDVLVVADAPEYRWPDIKGAQKQGVYHARSLGAADKIVQQLPFVKSVVVQIYDWNDIKSALALKVWGKEVTVVVPENTAMARMLEHDVCETIMKSFQEESWNVYYGQSIAEVLGDSETKAVRLSSGKVLAADMVIFGQMEARLRVLEDVAGDASVIEVNADFQSRSTHLYAFGDLAQRSGQKVTYWSMTSAEWTAQAKQLARVLSGQADGEEVSSVSVLAYAADLPNWSLKVFGDITPASNMVTFRAWNAETRVYQKIFTVNGKIKGAVVLNVSRTDSYEHLLTEQVAVAGYEKQVFDPALSWDQLKEALAQPLQEPVDEEWDFSGHPEGNQQAVEHMQQSS